MKLHRTILFCVLCIMALVVACTPTQTPPSTPLRGAVVPTRVTETPTLTPTVEETAELTATLSPTDEPTAEATATDEPTAEATATDEPTEEIVPTNTPGLTVEATEAIVIPSETPVLPSATPTLRPTRTPTPTSTPSPSATPTEAGIATPAAITETTIVYGDTATGTITNTVYEYRYLFEAQAGDVVSIFMRATDRQQGLDGYLTILAPNGAQLVVNDDFNSLQGYDPGIADYAIPTNGIYTIVASRFNGVAGTSVGDFELTLMVAEATIVTPEPTELADFTEIPIAYGDRAEGEITNEQPFVAYQFVAQAGDVVGIQVNMLSGTLDPQVVLFSPNGAEIASNDDDPLGGFNAYLRDYVIPEAGVYTIWATRFNRDVGTSSGRYELLLQRAGGGTVQTPISNSGTIALGEIVTGEITNQNFARFYTFSGTQGDVVTFTMRAEVGNLDPYLILIDPDGQQIARNDDGSGLGFNSALDKVILPKTGDYTIVATRFQVAFGVTLGTFQLSATADTGISQALIEILPIEYGTPQTGILGGGNFQYYGFNAEAGDIITIMHVNASGNLDPFLALEDAFGVEFARSYDDLFDENRNFDNAAIRNFTIPNTGYYVISAGYSGETSGGYTLTVTRTSTTSNIPQYGLLDWGKTAAFADGEQTSLLVSVGDWVLDNVERRVVSVLTFRLPPSDSRQLSSVMLSIESCYLTNNSVFTVFGELQISGLGYYASDVTVPIASEANPQPLATITACQDVDITDFVTQAYRSDATYVQIQLNFASNAVNRNAVIDAAIFLEPRLELYFGD